MKLYGIASRISNDIEDWYPSREDAERVLGEIVCDDPSLEDALYVEGVELDVGRN